MVRADHDSAWGLDVEACTRLQSGRAGDAGVARRSRRFRADRRPRASSRDGRASHASQSFAGRETATREPSNQQDTAMTRGRVSSTGSSPVAVTACHVEGVGSAGEPSRGRKTAPKRLGTRGRWRESDSHKPCGSTSRRFVSGARSHCGTARPTGGCHRRPGSPQTTGRVARERREANVLKNRGSARRRWLRRAT